MNAQDPSYNSYAYIWAAAPCISQEFGIWAPLLPHQNITRPKVSQNAATYFLTVTSAQSFTIITAMECPKCAHKMTKDTNKSGAEYFVCSSCHGLWVSFISFLKLFKGRQFSQDLINKGLTDTKVCSHPCPSCSKNLEKGFVEGTQLEIEQCRDCQYFFFDNKELSLFFQLVSQRQKALKPQKTKASPWQLIESQKQCPVCTSSSLYEEKDHPNQLWACPQCEGLLTHLSELQKLAERSLFGPTMFTYCDGQHMIATCRHCQEEQSSNNKSCRKCHEPIKNLQCPSCQSGMAEYKLNNIHIERCQFCNSVWMDKGEFKKTIDAMPDIRKHYEKQKRESELKAVESRAVSAIYAHSIQQTTREMKDRFWGPWGVFLGDY